MQPLIVLTSSESEEAGREGDDHDASPQPQHLSEQLLTPKPGVTSRDVPKPKKSHVKRRRHHALKIRGKPHREAKSRGLAGRASESARNHEISSEGEWESHDSLNTSSRSESMQEITLPESEANSSDSLLQISGDLLVLKTTDIDEARPPVLSTDEPYSSSTEMTTTSDATASVNRQAEVPYRGPAPDDVFGDQVETPEGTSKVREQSPLRKSSEEGVILAPQVVTGTIPKRIPKKKIKDPGLNPLSATRVGEQSREAAMVNKRVALYTSETWAPGALERVTHLIGEYQTRLEEHEREKLWLTTQLPQTFLIPKSIRIYDAEMSVHARRAENMRHLWDTRNTSATTAVPYPAQGDQWERWCLFCYRLLRSTHMSPHPAGCTCTNTLRYGTMEVESDEDTATLLSEKFWACQTFAETQEFLLMRLHARAFTQDIEPSATLVTGLSVDQWPVHMRQPHRERCSDSDSLPTSSGLKSQLWNFQPASHWPRLPELRVCKT